MKKWLMLGMALLVMGSLALSGCGNNNAAPSNQDNNATTQDTSSNASGDANKEAFTLSISSWFLDDTRPQNQLIMSTIEEKFKEKYPNAKIEWQNLISEKYLEKLKADLAAGTAADVIFSQNVPSYGKAGYFADLSDQPWVANMLDSTKPFETYEGKVFGAATTVFTTGVFYNKKIFADHQLNVPKTWDEFVAACETLKKNNITPIVAGFKDVWTASQTLAIIGNSTILAENPNYAFDLYDGKVKLNGPEMKDASDRFLELAQKGYFNKDALSLDWPGSLAAFEQSRAAMIFQGNWVPGMMDEDVKDKGAPKVEVGFFPIPNQNGRAALGASPDHSVSVNAKSEHLQAAKDLVSVILGQEAMAAQIKDTGLPGMKGVSGEYANPAMSEVLDAMNNNPSVVPVNSILIPDSALSEIYNGVLKVIGGGDFGNALDIAQQNYERDKAAIVMPQH